MRRRLGLITVVVLGLLATTPAAAAQANTAVAGTVAAVPAKDPGPGTDVGRKLKAAVRMQRSEASPGRDGKAVLEVPEPAVKRPKALRDPADCVRDALASKRVDDNSYIVCIGPGGPMPKLTPELLRRAPAVAAVDVVPLPDFCQEYGRGRWVYYRTQACAILTRTAYIYFPNGELAGTLNYIEVNFAYTSSIISAWAQQIQILMYGGTNAGLQPGTTVTGIGLCVNQCTTTRSEFPVQPVSTTTDPAGEAFFDSAITAPGARGFSYSVFRYTFQNVNWVPMTPGSAETPRLRCDNALPGSSTPGCVFPDYTPVHQYSRTGLYPELARHIADAQGSGLPGGPDDEALTRLTDRASIDNNRDRACPRADRGGYPRPATKSCDEYPMASTHQGAASSPPGSARTFDYCQINEPSGSGPPGTASA